jgi:ketosteroid isomerase-like protein
MDLKEIAEAVKTANETNTTKTLLDTLYAEDCVSVEAACMPGNDSPETAGLDAIRAKHAWWEAEMEFLSGTIEGPHLHGDDRFALVFKSVIREKSSGTEIPMEEVAIYTVRDGKIAREEFFYTL